MGPVAARAPVAVEEIPLPEPATLSLADDFTVHGFPEPGSHSRRPQLTSKPWPAPNLPRPRILPEHADDKAGKVIAEIERQGKLDNTLIFYIRGDKGSSSAGPPTSKPMPAASMQGSELP